MYHFPKLPINQSYVVCMTKCRILNFCINPINKDAQETDMNVHPNWRAKINASIDREPTIKDAFEYERNLSKRT